MSSEKPSFDPKVFVEQEGPNKGAIKDIELARAGAEATQRSIKRSEDGRESKNRYQAIAELAEKDGISFEESARRFADVDGYLAERAKVVGQLSEDQEDPVASLFNHWSKEQIDNANAFSEEHYKNLKERRQEEIE